ncbi:uncharacterized protein LOC144750075 [Ciona intestinalis]
MNVLFIYNYITIIAFPFSEQFSSKEDDLPCSVASNISEDKKQSGKPNTPQASVDYSYLSEILDKPSKQTSGSNQPVAKVKYEQPTQNKTSTTVDKNQKKKSKKTTRFTKKRSSTSNKKWRSPKRICSKSLVDIKTENPESSQIKYPTDEKQNLSQSIPSMVKSGGQSPILNPNTQNPNIGKTSLSHTKEISGASKRLQDVGPQTKETVRKPSDTEKCENNVRNIENNVSPKNTTFNQPVNQPIEKALMDASSGKAMFQDSQSSLQLQSAEPFQQRESTVQTSKQVITNHTSINTEPACLDLQALNADYALMNEYAPAEDCASLYLTPR